MKTKEKIIKYKRYTHPLSIVARIDLIESKIKILEKEYRGMDTEQLWDLDKGKTYTSYERNQIATFERCKKGKKVETTIFAKGNGVSKKHLFGRFIRLSGKGYIRVKPDGLRTISTYWVGFWQPK